MPTITAQIEVKIARTPKEVRIVLVRLVKK